jgi:drug/metabolite transporter (DMT)-like permease
MSVRSGETVGVSRREPTPGTKEEVAAGASPSPSGRPALVAAGVTVVLWASAFVAIRSAGRDFSPGALALGRLVCGTVVLGVVARARREGWPPRAAWPGIVTAGVLWFGVYTVALNWGEQKVDAGTAAIVVSLGPIIIALLSAWRLKEGFPHSVLAGLAVAFAGVIVVGAATAGSGHASVVGVLLCLLAALAFAIAVVSQKPALRHASALQVTTFGAAIGALACLPFSGQLVSQLGGAPFSKTLQVCYLGVFPTAVGFTTWAYALARTPAAKMGATTYLVPAITVLISWALLGQVPSGLAIVGGALCLAGVALSRRRQHSPTDREAASSLE